MRILTLFFFILISSVAPASVVGESVDKSIAFYYGEIDSVRELLVFDRVVVQPEMISANQLQQLHKAGTKVYAYLSVGEFDGENAGSFRAAVKTRNRDWNSLVMDLTNVVWQQHLFGRADQLVHRGFDGLFLDTLDSYTLFAAEGDTARAQQQGLVDILHGLQVRGPVILNRGFEVLPQLKTPPLAIAAESLLQTYSPRSKIYGAPPEDDQRWLRERMAEVKAMGIETIVIDYAETRDRQRQIAQLLLDAGYTPYVSTGLLDTLGVSSVESIPRRVLGFYSSGQDEHIISPCIRLLAKPLEYLGYVPECRDLENTDLSALDMSRYAAVHLWLTEEDYARRPELDRWLAPQVGVRPLLFIDDLPQAGETLERLGLEYKGQLHGDFALERGTDWLRAGAVVPLNGLDPIEQFSSRSSEVESLVEVRSPDGGIASLILRAPWGGAILSPLPVTRLTANADQWLLDPFSILGKLLKLENLPAPDVTTESGRRVLTAHIDGDGFPSRSWMPGKPFAAETILEKVLKKYNLPHTVSVIEGEIAPHGINPDLSVQLEALAKNIFLLPNVEVASHTYSHPFFYRTIGATVEKDYGDHLPIPGYEKIDFEREIFGSIEYINSRLVPPGKKVNVLLWSGTADPTEDHIRMAQDAGVWNVNGGNTHAFSGEEVAAQLYPTLHWHEDAVQVLAPVINENIYTSEWRENFGGYARAIETFEQFGAPRRLKSISIYYHMYSGVYPASLGALHKVYDWSLRQKVTPLYLSDYASRASALYETGVGRSLRNDQWLLVSTGITSVRVPDAMGIPQLTRSNLAGWGQGPDGRYLILSEARTRLSLSVDEDDTPRLMNSNGAILRWQKEPGVIQWNVKSYVPLELEFSHASHCDLISDVKFSRHKIDGNNVRFRSDRSGDISGMLVCKK